MKSYILSDFIIKTMKSFESVPLIPPNEEEAAKKEEYSGQIENGPVENDNQQSPEATERKKRLEQLEAELVQMLEGMMEYYAHFGINKEEVESTMRLVFSDEGLPVEEPGETNPDTDPHPFHQLVGLVKDSGLTNKQELDQLIYSILGSEDFSSHAENISEAAKALKDKLLELKQKIGTEAGQETSQRYFQNELVTELDDFIAPFETPSKDDLEEQRKSKRLAWVKSTANRYLDSQAPNQQAAA